MLSKAMTHDCVGAVAAATNQSIESFIVGISSYPAREYANECESQSIKRESPGPSPNSGRSFQSVDACPNLLKTKGRERPGQ
jgi:hypothetical protein